MTDTITRTDIETLRTEAGEYGDSDQVAICERALNGDKAAWAQCEDAIGDARAMA